MAVRLVPLAFVLFVPSVAFADLVVDASTTVYVQSSPPIVAAPVDAAPEPIIVHRSEPSSALPPPPVVVQSPPSYGGYPAWREEPGRATRSYAPPPTVVVRPVETGPTYDVVPAPAIVTVEDPAWSCDGCSCTSGCGSGDREAGPAQFDLVAVGAYRHVFEAAELGGFNTALRLLLLDSLSLELGVGYYAGGTSTGGSHEELPVTVNVLWYPWTREAPFYLAAGAFARWAGVWRESLDPLWGYGRVEDQWFAGGRLAAGLEFEVWDFLLLGAEVEAFYRSRERDGDPDGEAGVAVSLGLGLRI
jgi:hypothetical protein